VAKLMNDSVLLSDYIIIYIRDGNKYDYIEVFSITT
jgi:hypothetical protein